MSGPRLSCCFAFRGKRSRGPLSANSRQTRKHKALQPNHVQASHESIAKQVGDQESERLLAMWLLGRRRPFLVVPRRQADVSLPQG